jgi:hypothetical protein
MLALAQTRRQYRRLLESEAMNSLLQQHNVVAMVSGNHESNKGSAAIRDFRPPQFTPEDEPGIDSCSVALGPCAGSTRVAHLGGTLASVRRTLCRPGQRRRHLMADILDVARTQVLGQGAGLSREQALACLRLPDDQVDDLLDLAHGCA